MWLRDGVHLITPNLHFNVEANPKSHTMNHIYASNIPGTRTLKGLQNRVMPMTVNLIPSLSNNEIIKEAVFLTGARNMFCTFFGPAGARVAQSRIVSRAKVVLPPPALGGQR